MTGVKVVDTIITELAVIGVTPSGFVLEEIAPDVTIEQVQEANRTASPPSPGRPHHHAPVAAAFRLPAEAVFAKAGGGRF